LKRVLEARSHFVTRPSFILMAQDQIRDCKLIAVYLLVCEFWLALRHTFYSKCEVSVLELKTFYVLFSDSQVMSLGLRRAQQCRILFVSSPPESGK
jgi:hypothetical protein